MIQFFLNKEVSLNLKYDYYFQIFSVLNFQFFLLVNYDKHINLKYSLYSFFIIIYNKLLKDDRRDHSICIIARIIKL